MTSTTPFYVYNVVISTVDALGKDNGTEMVDTIGVYESLQDANEHAKQVLAEQYDGHIDPGFIDRWTDDDKDTISYDDAGCLNMFDYPEEVFKMGYTSPFKVTVQMHEVIRRKNGQSFVVLPELDTEQKTPIKTPDESAPIEPALKETAKTQTVDPPETRSSKKRSIDEVSTPSSLPVPKRPVAALPSKSTASAEIAPLPTDIPIFENVTLYDIVINKSYKYGSEASEKSGTCPKPISKEQKSHYFDKEAAIAAFIEEVSENPKEHNANPRVEEQERFLYDKDGLPYTTTPFENEDDSVMTEMKISPNTYEVIFRKREPEMDFVEVVSKIHVSNWDGTKEQYYHKLRHQLQAGAEVGQKNAE